MFSQKKKVPWGWIAIIIVLAAFGILALFAALTDEPVREDNSSKSDEYTSEENIAEWKETSAPAMKSCYLVKNDENIVKVYFFDEEGKSIELEETGIIYEILSESDQKKLDEGIRLSSREELNKLIMDYES